MSKHVEVAHHRVGDLRVPEEEIIEVTYIPGFPDAHRFVLLEHSEKSPFLWMACLDDLDLVFAVTDPCFFFPDYDPQFDQQELDAIDAKQREQVSVLAIANLRDPAPALNLAAPLLLNRATHKATQLLLSDDRFSTRQPLPAPSPQVQAPAPASQEKPATRGQDEPQTAADGPVHPPASAVR